MSELWLTYIDIDGAEKRVRVDSAKFVIGRHSSSDLCIMDGRLSREHLKIERSGDVFTATDCGSSNGTKINDAVLDSPVTLKDEDALDLGGLSIQTELQASTLPADQTPEAAA